MPFERERVSRVLGLMPRYSGLETAEANVTPRTDCVGDDGDGVVRHEVLSITSTLFLL